MVLNVLYGPCNFLAETRPQRKIDASLHVPKCRRLVELQKLFRLGGQFRPAKAAAGIALGMRTHEEHGVFNVATQGACQLEMLEAVRKT